VEVVAHQLGRRRPVAERSALSVQSTLRMQRSEVTAMTPTTDWLARLSRLRIDRARGHPAPHKPLLLLSILTRLDDGETLPAVVPLAPELAFRFLTLGTVVAHRQSQRLDVRLPFHHLQSDGIWDALTQDGQPSPEFRRTAAARLNANFAAFISDEHNRANAKLVLGRLDTR
jgi:putative restriction endonuclease